MNGFGFLVLGAACVAVLIIVLTMIVRKYFIFKKRETEKIRELGGERKLYETVYGSKDEMYIMLGASDKIPRYVSSGSHELLGITKADIMADIYALKRGVVASDINGFEKDFSLWNKSDSLSREFEFIHMESGEKKIGMVVISYNRMDDLYCILIRDITKEAGEKLKIKNELERLRNLNKYRNEFISNISNEVRTPINSMKGKLTLMEMNSEKAEEVKKYAADMFEQTDILLGLLNNMFDISRIENGEMVFENNEFDMLALSRIMKETYTASAAEKGLSFDLEMNDFNVRYLMGDEKRLLQIFLALMSYAQSVTPKGGKVSMNIRQMNNAKDTVNFLFRIRDGGKELSQYESAVLFETGSSGNIALTVAYQYIRAMDGRLVCESRDGGNDYSIFFTFELSDRVQDMSLPIESNEELVNENFTFEGCKILLAEDNQINAETTKELLEMMGAIVDMAENGAVAVDKFMNGGVGRYNAILMDVEMPVMNGLEATKRIRSLAGAEAKKIPIFALSANTFAEDRKSSIAAGMNAHLSKPIEFEVLKNELAKYL